MRTYYDTIDDALREWGRFELYPHRRSAAVQVVDKVIAADGPRAPTFYVTGGRNYVGVFADDGHRLVRIQGRQIWSRWGIDGVSMRVTPPDEDLPYRWDL